MMSFIAKIATILKKEAETFPQESEQVIELKKTITRFETDIGELKKQMWELQSAKCCTCSKKTNATY